MVENDEDDLFQKVALDDPDYKDWKWMMEMNKRLVQKSQDTPLTIEQIKEKIYGPKSHGSEGS